MAVSLKLDKKLCLSRVLWRLYGLSCALNFENISNNLFPQSFRALPQSSIDTCCIS